MSNPNDDYHARQRALADQRRRAEEQAFADRITMRRIAALEAKSGIPSPGVRMAMAQTGRPSTVWSERTVTKVVKVRHSVPFGPAAHMTDGSACWCQPTELEDGQGYITVRHSPIAPFEAPDVVEVR